MELEYAQNRLSLLKWFFRVFLIISILATPVLTMEAINGERPAWDLAAGPIGILVFIYFSMRVRKMSKQVGPVVSVTGEGIMLRELGKNPIPWTSIASISSLRMWIVISLKEGELEKLKLGKLNLRTRRLGPLSDKTITLSPALYSVSETVLREEIKKQARAACGEAIRLDL